MKTKKTGLSRKARMETGAAVIAASQVTDVTAIKPRMTLFINAHGDYVEVQAAVEAADIGRRKGKADLQGYAGELAIAVEDLARACVIDGAPRDTPFVAFETGAPFVIKRLSVAAQAKATRTLLDAILESKTISTATRRAARTAEQAVGAVETAVLTLSKATATARMARDTRAEVAQAWDEALAALKRAARAAADDGAPGLYAALFGGLRRSKAKKAASAPVNQPANPAPMADSPATSPAAST